MGYTKHKLEPLTWQELTIAAVALLVIVGMFYQINLNIISYNKSIQNNEKSK